MVLQQTASPERIAELDVIRGLAVLGIFFVNVPDMLGNGTAFRSGYTGFDAFIRLVYDMFFQTKFYSILSFLFGLGFFLFMQSAERRGLRPKVLFGRRLLFLLLIGLAHGVLLWFGDVLYTYAMIGFLLPLFFKRSAKTVLIWSLSLLGLFAASITLVMILLNVSGFTKELSPPMLTQIPDLSGRLDFLLTQGLPNVAILSFEVLGLFLLGLYAGKKRWFETRSWSPKVLLRIMGGTLLISVLLYVPMVSSYLSDALYIPDNVYHFTYLSGKAMAVFYVCTLLLLMQRLGTDRFRGLAAVGRMALTNYLLQTVITMALVPLFWIRLDSLPLWIGTVYAAVIVTIQVVCSKLWLRRYRMGPAEWVWRAGTYGTLPGFRQAKKHAEERRSALGG